MAGNHGTCAMSSRATAREPVLQRVRFGAIWGGLEPPRACAKSRDAERIDTPTAPRLNNRILPPSLHPEVPCPAP